MGRMGVVKSCARGDIEKRKEKRFVNGLINLSNAHVHQWSMGEMGAGMNGMVYVKQHPDENHSAPLEEN